jgi:hypothetical protein
LCGRGHVSDILGVKTMSMDAIINGSRVYVTKLEGPDDHIMFGGGEQVYHVVIAPPGPFREDGSKFHTGNAASCEQFIVDTVIKNNQIFLES